MCFSHEDEWVLAPGQKASLEEKSPWRPGAGAADAQALLARLVAEKNQEAQALCHSSLPWRQEGLVLAALQLEARWWREQRQEQRQHGLNGHHGFWILKATVTGASRGVFCV